MGRYDFFRILLPGAIVTAIVDVVARIVLATSPTPWTDAARLIGFIEQPLPAVVVSFGIGLVLYMVDPAYSAPEYWQRIPSEHLKLRLLQCRAPATDVISLYFLASDARMPNALQERTLLYGALFRTGFQLTVYVLAAGAITPWVILFHPSVDRTVVSESPLVIPAGFSLLVTIVVVYATQVIGGVREKGDGPFSILRNALKEADKQLLSQPSAIAVFIATTIAATMASLAVRSGQGTRWGIGILGTTLAAWAFLRFLGPVGPRVEKVMTSSSGHPADPFRSTCRLTLDLSPVMAGTLGLLTVSSVASEGQIVAVASLLVMGFVLSFTRKVERQQNGIYRNQNAWIDLNLDTLVKDAERLAPVQAQTGPRGG